MFWIDRQRTDDIALRRLPSIRGGVTWIWLVDSHSLFTDHNEIIARLNSSDNFFLLHYTKVSKCTRYLKQAKPYECIILVLHTSFIDEKSRVTAEGLSRFDRYDQIKSIFIVSPDQENDTRCDAVKPTHVFRDYQSMFIKLQDS